MATGFLLHATHSRHDSRIDLYAFPLLLLTHLGATVDGHVLRQNATREHRLIVTEEGVRVREQLITPWLAPLKGHARDLGLRRNAPSGSVAEHSGEGRSGCLREMHFLAPLKMWRLAGRRGP